MVVDAVVHISAVAVHVPVPRVETPTGSRRPEVHAEANIAERTAVVAAAWQSGKSIIIRAHIGAPQVAVGLELSSGGSTHMGFQGIPFSGIG